MSTKDTALELPSQEKTKDHSLKASLLGSTDVSDIEHLSDEHEKIHPRNATYCGSSLGMLLMNVRTICSFVFIVPVKMFLNQGVTVMDISFFRALANITITSTLFLASGKSLTEGIPNRSKVLLGLRAVSGQTGFIINVLAYQYLPITYVTITTNTYPLIASVFAFFIFADRILRQELAALVFSFLGVVLIATSDNTTVDATTVEQVIGFGCSVSIAFIMAFASIVTRYLNHIHWKIMMMYYALAGITITGTYLFVEIWVLQLRTWDYPWHYYFFLYAIGGVQTTGTIFYTMAFQIEKTGRAALVEYLSLVYLCLADVFIFHFAFTAQEIAGCLLIVTFTVLVTCHKVFKIQ